MITDSIENTTKAEFVNFIQKIMNVGFRGERANNNAVMEFARISEHPRGWGLIYHPESGSPTAEDVANEVERWRLENGKPGFKQVADEATS